MLKELIQTKINEVFAEYQQANNIISGDIDPMDAMALEQATDKMSELIERICAKQLCLDNFTPSWYIYADYEGNLYSKHFGEVDTDYFFTNVSRKIAFADCDDTNVIKIYFHGKEVFYRGWKPGMKYEYHDLYGNTVWVGYFPEWDH